MKVSTSVVRFLFEAAFIILIAAATAVARLGKLWIALAVGGAWLLVALVERASLENRVGGRLALLFGRRSAGEPVADEPAPPEAPPEPAAAEPAREPAPEPAPRPIETPPPELRSVPEPEPEPEPAPAPAPVVTYLPRADGAPREWNIWELERIAREREGEDAARDEELAYLLVELRQFANADGQLPSTFDPVVRDAFGADLTAV